MTALYYLDISVGYQLMKVKLVTSERFSNEEPQSYFNGGDNFVFNGLDIHPDGYRFHAVKSETSATQEENEPRIKVIVNWEHELEDK